LIPKKNRLERILECFSGTFRIFCDTMILIYFLVKKKFFSEL